MQHVYDRVRLKLVVVFFGGGEDFCLNSNPERYPSLNYSLFQLLA